MECLPCDPLFSILLFHFFLNAVEQSKLLPNSKWTTTLESENTKCENHYKEHCCEGSAVVYNGSSSERPPRQPAAGWEPREASLRHDMSTRSPRNSKRSEAGELMEKLRKMCSRQLLPAREAARESKGAGLDWRLEATGFVQGRREGKENSLDEGYGANRAELAPGRLWTRTSRARQGLQVGWDWILWNLGYVLTLDDKGRLPAERASAEGAEGNSGLRLIFGAVPELLSLMP